MEAAAPANPHSFDHEVTVVITSGRAVVGLDGVEHDVVAGDAVVIPAEVLYSLANPYDEPLELIQVMPVGALARMASGATLVPPPAE